jgi:putative ABC transport system permease protein
MTSVLSRASRNFLWQHPWQLALAIVGITLGVAVVIAIDLAIDSALQSFDRVTQSIASGASHRIVAGDGGLDEAIYTRLRVEQGIQNLTPIVQGEVKTIPESGQKNNEKLTLYGIDPFAENAIRSIWYGDPKSQRVDDIFSRFISESGAVIIGSKIARRYDLAVDDSLPVLTDSGKHRLTIIAIIKAGNQGSQQALENLLISDIATAQELLGFIGKLSYIEVRVDDTPDQKHILASIHETLPKQVLIIDAESRSRSIQQLTEAFSINLMALGLLSLLVGMFLIYNTMTFLVVQRRRLIGCLRALGVTRRQIFRLIMSEALILALIGTTIGILLGIVLGQGLLLLVSETINTIYFRVDSVTLLLTPQQVAKGVLLGIGGTMLAVMPPAIEATAWTPHTAMMRSQLETATRKLTGKAAALGLLIFVLGLALAFTSGSSIALGLGSIFLLLFGFALLMPGITLLTMKLAERLLGKAFGVLGRLPARMVTAELSRTGVAIAALMIAVSATVGMDLMINSFRQTVSDWVQISLRADLYVALSGSTEASEKLRSDQQLKTKLSHLNGVLMLSSVLHTQVINDNQLVPLAVFELNTKSRQGFIIKSGQATDLWERFNRQPTLIITEAYAYHNGIELGQKIVLTTPQGNQAFEVIAIYVDYSGDRGHLSMSRQNYLYYWPDLGYSGIGIYADEGSDLEQLQDSIEKILLNNQRIQSNKGIYQASMDIFEQTFSITETLRWLAGGIAFVGVFSALMALQFERSRQLGVLRAIGITPRQLTVLITTETGLMGLVAGLFSVPAGYLVAYVLIHVVYQRAFGWTMAFHVNPATFYQGVALAVIAALLAGIYPAYKMARTRPAEALRME